MIKFSTFKNIKDYSALAASLLAFHQFSDAQIVYTKLAPEVEGVGNGSTFNLDLNNDSIVDFSVTINSIGTRHVKIIAEAASNGYNAIAGYNGSSAPVIFPSPLGTNAVIGPDENWNLGGNQILAGIGGSHTGTGTSSTTGTDKFGLWIGAIDAYMGLRLHADNNTYYGWLRMDVSPDGRYFTAKDYAYQSTPNVSIKAGDIGGNVGVASLKNNDIQIFSIDKKIIIELTNLSDNATITIENLLGAKIAVLHSTGSTNTVDLSDQPIGIYLVNIEQNGNLYSKKILIR